MDDEDENEIEEEISRLTAPPSNEGPSFEYILKRFWVSQRVSGGLRSTIQPLKPASKKVDYFVLLIDESLRLARGIEGDGYEDIRGALLNTKFGSKVHAGLVKRLEQFSVVQYLAESKRF